MLNDFIWGTRDLYHRKNGLSVVLEGNSDFSIHLLYTNSTHYDRLEIIHPTSKDSSNKSNRTSTKSKPTNTATHKTDISQDPIDQIKSKRKIYHGTSSSSSPIAKESTSASTRGTGESSGDNGPTLVRSPCSDMCFLFWIYCKGVYQSKQFQFTFEG